MKLIIKIVVCLLFTTGSRSYGQMKQYHYKRVVKGISESWHKIILPDEIFGKCSQSLTDIRIFGITANKDTIEAPYLLRVMTEKISNKSVFFKTLNVSHNKKGYYFTFEIPASEPVNQIRLDFKEQNFDWRIKLEGSQNQDEWFTVMENYRILSIKNELTNFQFTKLSFPNSKYRYYRLFINNKEKPELTVASIAQDEIADGTFRNYLIRKTDKKENKQMRQTETEIELPLPVPVSLIKMEVADTFDYYRPVTIKYLADSFKTEQGWKYNYSPLTSATLNSLEENEFKFSSTIMKRFKIFIHNQDNQPLTIGTIKVKGYVYELVARFTEQATYFLTYGNERATKPEYDINRFSKNVPTTLTALEWGKELTVEKEELLLPADPLFKNKNWLWAIMGIIMLLLGWFSVKMMRKN